MTARRRHGQPNLRLLLGGAGCGRAPRLGPGRDETAVTIISAIVLGIAVGWALGYVTGKISEHYQPET